MKKALFSLAALSLFAAAPAQAENLSVTSTVAWESEYVFRGLQYAKSNFQPTIDVAFADSYLGVWAMLPTESGDSRASEVNFYAGHRAQVDDSLSMDFGATLYYFRNYRRMSDPEPDFRLRSDDRTQIEVYAGAGFDVPLAPSLYLYYNFDAKIWTLEGSAGRAFPVTNNLDLVLGGHVGHAWRGLGAADYLYGGVTADFTVAVAPNASLSFGPRLTFNDVDADDPEMAAIEVSTNLWWGVSFTAGF